MGGSIQTNIVHHQPCLNPCPLTRYCTGRSPHPYPSVIFGVSFISSLLGIQHITFFLRETGSARWRLASVVFAGWTGFCCKFNGPSSIHPLQSPPAPLSSPCHHNFKFQPSIHPALKNSVCLETPLFQHPSTIHKTCSRHVCPHLGKTSLTYLAPLVKACCMLKHGNSSARHDCHHHHQDSHFHTITLLSTSSLHVQLRNPLFGH